MSNPYEPHDLDRHEEQGLRDLLDHATADVQPTDALDDIRSRTSVTSLPGRPWLIAATAAVVTTAATVVAVALVGSGNDPTGSPPEPGPAASGTTAAEQPTVEDPSTSEPTPTKSTEPVPVEGAVPVYYLGDTGQGPRLYREFHPSIGGAPLAQAVADAVSRTPDDPDYRSPWPTGTEVAGSVGRAAGDEIGIAVTSPAGTSLHDRPSGTSPAEAEMAVQQLVYTAQAALQSSAPVQFRLDGDRTDQLLGVPVAEPVTRADQAATLAQVWIISPAEGAEVKSGFEVAGVGSFFEANVAWELREGDENGRVVASNADAPVTAQECCTMAPYSFTVDASPGEYTLVVHDEDMSDGEGFTPFQDTKALTVTR